MPEDLLKKVHLIGVNASLPSNRDKPVKGAKMGAVNHKLGQVTGFPSFRLYKGHKLVAEIEERPTYESLVKFLRKNVE